MPVFALALALVAAPGASVGGALPIALFEVGGAATADDRAAATQLVDDALTARGLLVRREGHAPADCGAPCMDQQARRGGVELAIAGTLSSSAEGLTLFLGFYDVRRADAGVAHAEARGADLNSLGAALGGSLDGLLSPALALRGEGADKITEGLGWGTPGLILGGALAVSGVALAGVGCWPFLDRALGAAELERLQGEGASPAERSAAAARVSAAHQALTEWGLTALSLGAGATLLGAAMMSAAAE